MPREVDDQRKDRVRRDFVALVPRILSIYEDLLAKYPMAFVDESRLPVSKPFLKEALKEGWNAAKNDNDRDRIVRGWGQLKYFQPDVGGNPIGATSVDRFSSENSDEAARWISLLHRCEIEEEANSRERVKYFGAT
jgi:hypothetical protein